MTKVMADKTEVVGYGPMPARDPKHAEPHWFECDLDDPESDDPDCVDPLPTERHRRVPGMS